MDGQWWYFFFLFSSGRTKSTRNTLLKERERGREKNKKKWNVIVSSNSDFCRFTRGKKARDQIIGWWNVSKRKQNCVPNVRRLKNHLKIFNCPQNCTALFTSITVIHRYRYPSFSRSLVLLLRNRKEKRTCAGARSSYLRNEKCITSSIESQAIVLSTVAVSLSSFSFQL